VPFDFCDWSGIDVVLPPLLTTHDHWVTINENITGIEILSVIDADEFAQFPGSVCPLLSAILREMFCTIQTLTVMARGIQCLTNPISGP
jgi:hypothetical protein